MTSVVKIRTSYGGIVASERSAQMSTSGDSSLRWPSATSGLVQAPRGFCINAFSMSEAESHNPSAFNQEFRRLSRSGGGAPAGDLGRRVLDGVGILHSRAEPRRPGRALFSRPTPSSQGELWSA